MTNATVTPIRASIIPGGRVPSDGTLSRYLAGANADGASWLGMLVIYSTAEINFAYADLLSLLTQHGLEEFAPRKPSDVDVFRRSITSVQSKRNATEDPEVYLNILTRDVSNDDVEVVKRLVIESVDPKGRRLRFDPMYDWIFNKTTSRVDMKRLPATIVDADTQRLADATVMEAVTRFQKLVGTVDGAAIRGVINKALVESKAVSFRPGGGCYFLHAAQADIAAGLEAVAAHIPGTLVHTVPLLDTAAQRDHVAACVEADSAAEVVELNKMVEEIASVLRTGVDVSAEKFAALARRVRKLTDKAAAYKERLDSDLVQTSAAVDILTLQLAQLSGMRPARASTDSADSAGDGDAAGAA